MTLSGESVIIIRQQDNQTWSDLLVSLRKSGANPELFFAVFNVKRGRHYQSACQHVIKDRDSSNYEALFFVAKIIIHKRRSKVKKKELMKRMSAVAMAALMTVTMIPSNSFAAYIEFSDGGEDAIEVQADTDEEADAELSVQNEESDDAENLTIGDASQDEISDTEVFSVEEDENASDSDDIAAFSDADSDTDLDAEAKAAAKKWLEENYIRARKKLISNGAKSADGLSYTIDIKSKNLEEYKIKIEIYIIK